MHFFGYGRKSTSRANAGVSMVATMLTLLFLAVFAAVVVSVITLSGNIGLQEEQGFQALYIAEGGLQYAPLVYNFPNYTTPAAVNLGIGSFTTSVPQLTAAVDNAQTTISVTSTDGFPLAPDNQYWVMTGTSTNPLTTSDAVEKISFTAKTALTFTGGTRGRDSSTPAVHPSGAAAMIYNWYPAIATTLSSPANAGDTTINVASTAGFSPQGFIRITQNNENLNEDIQYAGITATSFTGCVRGAYSGATGNNHGNGRPVEQVEISVLTTSRGIVTGPASGVIFTDDVQRRVQAAIMPLE